MTLIEDEQRQKCRDMKNTVSVAVRIRPQNARERAAEEKICIFISQDEPQITIGRDKSFTYDFVFSDQSTQEGVYNQCIHNLLVGAFDGYNATVLAYGQTGSGKTYTMGTCFDVNQFNLDTNLTAGIIPRAARHLFEGIEERRLEAKTSGAVEPTFELNVQFIELYNEEIVDLLSDDRSRNTVIRIQEDPVRNEIGLKGATWQSVKSALDIMSALKAGALNRTTAATNMNQQSSRSHAIFTIRLKQTRVVPMEENEDDSPKQKTELEVLHAKFHFVDLAGSERLKRTGATGDRAKEGISINSGLLALGNVISALGSGKVTHVPYRDSKLTRLLQDSLGGNSRTLMIACASPCDVDFIETLNTLNYANRAKNIKNKIVANQDKSSKLITDLRTRISILESQLLEYQQGKRLLNEDGEELLNDQYTENLYLKNENTRLSTRLKALDEKNNILNSRIIELTKERELSKFRGALENKENDGSSSNEENQLSSIIQGYLQEIETLKSNIIEYEVTNETLRKQNQRFRDGMNSSLYGSPYVSQPQSSNLTESLINQAREEIEMDKKALNEAEAKSLNQVDKEQNFLDAVYEEENTDDEDGETDPAEQMSLERRDQIHSDLAKLHEDISIKERLVVELEMSQRRLEQLRRDFENKMEELCKRIQSTEAERDNVLEQMTAKKQTKQQKEEINKVKEQYEKRLSDMRLEHKRIEVAERENKKMQAQQNRHQMEVVRMKNDLENMKRQKVELMKRLKEENKRIREIQVANAQKVATYEKTQRQQQNKIQKLERESALKSENLRRKAEEVQRLKDSQKALQARRQTIYESKRAVRSPNTPQQVQLPTSSDMDTTYIVENEPSMNNENVCYTPTTNYVRTPKYKQTPIRTKRQWNAIERAIEGFTVKRNAIVREEHALDRMCSERRNLQDELLRLQSNYSSITDPSIRCLVLEQQSSIQQKLDYVQEEILRAQKAIVDLDDEQICLEPSSRRASAQAFPAAYEGVKDLDSLMFQFSRQFAIPQEMLYILRNLIDLTIQKGADNTRLESENKELTALLGIESNEDMRDVVESAKLNFQLRMNQEHDTTFMNVPENDYRPTTLSNNNANLLSLFDDILPIPICKGDEPSPEKLASSEATCSTSDSALAMSSNSHNELGKEESDTPDYSRNDCSTDRSDLTEPNVSKAGKRHLKKAPEFVPVEDKLFYKYIDLQRIYRVYGHQKGVLCLHSNETKMISGSKDRNALVWDLETGSNIATLGSHPNIVYSVRLLPDEQNMALSSSMNIVKLWDLRAAPTERCIRHLSSMGLVSQGENGHCERIRQLPPTETDIYQMEVCSNSAGNFLFTTSAAGVRIWDLEKIEHLGMLRDLTDSGDVRMLAVSEVSDSSSQNSNMSVRIATATKKCASLYDEVKIQKPFIPSRWVNLEPGHTKTITSLCFSQNALFTASKDQALTLLFKKF
uniref:Kinesin motor domain-containing protein n=1 Tax=Meloidogyne incognita TaxID=6306 RepID=A0A914M1U5_MELIC